MGYGKIITIVRYSDVSDYSDNLVNRTFEDEYLSTRCERFEVNCVAGVAKVIDFGVLFASPVKSVVVSNKGTANYITVAVTSALGSTTEQKIFAGDSIRLTDAVPDGDITLTADTTDAVVEVIVFGT